MTKLNPPQAKYNSGGYTYVTTLNDLLNETEDQTDDASSDILTHSRDLQVIVKAYFSRVVEGFQLL
jgi:polyhydroxyalkanoate synthesis regulator protein